MPNINLKKLWRRKSVDITDYDPTYKVIYLGNVLTNWAKGEGCVEKPLATLWRNYCQSSRPDISMKITICGAGLRAVTQEHGLTEYWAHRVTYCAAHRAYPRVFCWVYRHEGRRLKQDLRCHAVLCPKQAKAEAMCAQLRDRLTLALHEFRREKAIRQNARLSVINAVYDVTIPPRRKFYLVTGSSNYRPPLERSKSAPKLGAIEELLEEEEEEEEEDEMEQEHVAQNGDCSLSSPIDTLLNRLRRRGPNTQSVMSSEDVAFVYQQVDDNPADGIEGVTYSSPNLLLTSQIEKRNSLESRQKSHLPRHLGQSLDDGDYQEVPFIDSCLQRETQHIQPSLPSSALEHPHDSSIDARLKPEDDLGLLESLKDKLGLTNLGGEESLTSDQPESIGSQSCSSSCGSGDDTLIVGTCRNSGDDPLIVGSPCEGEGDASLVETRGEKGDEDNISEESGYSEGKECTLIKV